MRIVASRGAARTRAEIGGAIAPPPVNGRREKPVRVSTKTAPDEGACSARGGARSQQVNVNMRAGTECCRVPWATASRLLQQPEPLLRKRQRQTDAPARGFDRRQLRPDRAHVTDSDAENV